MMLPKVITNGPWGKRWMLSYMFDYLVIIVLIIGFSALDLAEPYHQRFSLTNESLQYPYADPERISAVWAAVISCLFPLVCIVVWTMLIDGMYSHHKPATNRARIMGGPWQLSDRLWEMNCGILGLGLSVAGAICITGALKNATGKPRPDIIARCLPKPGSANGSPFGLVTSAICTRTDGHILKDGFKSWPSGHSSVAFAGLGFLSLFLAGKLHLMDNRGEVWKTVLVLIPLLAAALVAVSRIMDARHHPFDVITGSMLGQLTAWIAYRQYFPSISNPALKGRAFSRRTWGADTHELVNDPESAAEYTDAHNLRNLEEGRTASSESLDSGDKVGTRKRVAPPALGIPGRSRTLTESSSAPLQGQQHEFELLPQRTGAFPPDPPPHKHWPTQQDTEYRGSVDMGERARRLEGEMSSPESIGRPLRLGRLSPPVQERLDEARG